MADGIASLRHRAFAVKLTLRKVAGYYSDIKRARLAERAPELEDYVAAPRLRTLFEEFRETHKRLETTLLDEMVRLSIEAERTVNAYARTRYGFGPGDDIQLGYPDPASPVRLRVHKVFLQSAHRERHPSRRQLSAERRHHRQPLGHLYERPGSVPIRQDPA
jgi:hypothetical protein